MIKDYILSLWVLTVALFKREQWLVSRFIRDDDHDPPGRRPDYVYNEPGYPQALTVREMGRIMAIVGQWDAEEKIDKLINEIDFE